MMIDVVVVSKDGNFLLRDLDPEESSGDIRFFRVVNSANENITSIYNSFLEKFLASKETDFLVLMHADVSLDLRSLKMHIEECSGKYDIMGLCGCEVINVSRSPLNWFTGSMDNPGRRWGCVTHGELGNQTSFFSRDREEVTDHAVSCIDGLCIIISRKAAESGIRFNENLRFDCYDTDLCLNAIMNKGLRIGCLVETSLVHHSVGKSILGREFLDSEREMRKDLGLDMAPLEKALEKFGGI